MGVGVVTEASFRLKFTKSCWFAMSIISQAFPSPADATGSQSSAVKLWVPALGDKQGGTRLEGESPVFPLAQVAVPLSIWSYGWGCDGCRDVAERTGG